MSGDKRDAGPSVCNKSLSFLGENKRLKCKKNPEVHQAGSSHAHFTSTNREAARLPHKDQGLAG